MVPWNKLSKETQRAILALFVMSGSAASTRCCPPVICDPPPPPRTSSPIPRNSPIFYSDPTPPPARTPTPVRSPIICDPAPPPARTPTPVRSPIICDPAPPPSRTIQATATRAVSGRYQLRSFQMTTDANAPGAVVQGKVLDAKGQPVANVPITLQGNALLTSATAPDGSFSILVTNVGAYSLIIGGDKSNAQPLQLKQHDVAILEYLDLGSQLILPLAEIRSVDIVWGDDLTFQVDTPWQGARYRWSISGGALIEEGDGVTWESPPEPGRYLLQLIADWGRDGLAIDVLTLFVTEDGNIVIG